MINIIIGFALSIAAQSVLTSQSLSNHPILSQFSQILKNFEKKLFQMAS